MAAAGARSSGAGLEAVPFPCPVSAVGRLEVWVKDVDRQLMSAIARDVETCVDTLRQYRKAGEGLGRPALLHIGGGADRKASSATMNGGGGGGGEGGGGAAANDNAGLQSRSGAEPSAKQHTTGGNSPSAAAGKGGGGEGFAAGGKSEPGRGEDQASTAHRPSVQAQLLARSVHWTASVETALSADSSFWPMLSPGDVNSNGHRGNGSAPTVKKPGHELQQILAVVARDVNGWVEELCEPGGLTAYNSLTNTALITQALQQRDVVEQLMQSTPISTSSPSTPPSTTLEGRQRGFASTAGSETASSDVGSGEDRVEGAAGVTEHSPFLWTCHLRHYYTSPSETKAREEGGQEGNSNGHSSDNDKKWAVHDNGEDHQNVEDSIPPPPLIRVGLGPWNVPYGFEYAGTWERLWLTPLSERCLLHAIHSAKVRPWPATILCTYRLEKCSRCALRCYRFRCIAAPVDGFTAQIPQMNGRRRTCEH